MHSRNVHNGLKCYDDNHVKGICVIKLFAATVEVAVQIGSYGIDSKRQKRSIISVDKKDQLL